MITYKIHFIRTGRTSVGQSKRYVGQTNPPLCDEGIQELRCLRKEFDYPKVQMVYTSPLERCLQTADILYPDLYVQEVEGLMDMSLGRFEGCTFDELRGDEDFARWMANSADNTPPGGEELSHFTQRIIDAVRDIFHQMMEEKITSAAVITHGGVIMTLLAAIGQPKEPLHQWATGNGAGYTLLFTPQMWMRDSSAEIFCRIPESAVTEGLDVYNLYFDKE